MSDHLRVDESLVEDILKLQSWADAKVNISKDSEEEPQKVEEATEEVKEEEEVVEETSEEEVLCCPLCEQELQEELSEDRISEHVQGILEMLETLNEEEELDEGAEEHGYAAPEDAIPDGVSNPKKRKGADKECSEGEAPEDS